jgi:hypothetical protein
MYFGNYIDGDIFIGISRQYIQMNEITSISRSIYYSSKYIDFSLKIQNDNKISRNRGCSFINMNQ